MFDLPVMTTDDTGRTVWNTRGFPAELRGGMRLTPRIAAGSLRLRTSEPGYVSDWHVAGEAVLIVVQRGVLRIELRDGSSRDFGPGDAFIAADGLGEGAGLDGEGHGHRARVVGDARLEAVHVKLEGFAQGP